MPNLDPKLLMRDLHRNVDLTSVPRGRTVVPFDLTDVPTRQRRWWMVLTPEEVDICDVDPGHEVAAAVSGSLRELVLIWRGDRTWRDALRQESVTVTGSEPMRRKIPVWFGPSRFAAVPRPAVDADGTVGADVPELVPA